MVATQSTAASSFLVPLVTIGALFYFVFQAQLWTGFVFGVWYRGDLVAEYKTTTLSIARFLPGLLGSLALIPVFQAKQTALGGAWIGTQILFMVLPFRKSYSGLFMTSVWYQPLSIGGGLTIDGD